MLNLNEDQLKMLKDAMETLQRHYKQTAKDAQMELTKARAINDSIRCDRIIDEIDKELVSLDDY